MTNGRPLCILVIGAHRSGTSMIAGMLRKSGVYLGPNNKLRGPDENNQRGYFEHKDILHLNYRILKSIGIYFWDTKKIVWNNKTIRKVFQHEEEALSVIKEMKKKNIFAIKDAKISRLLPFWTKCLNKEGVEYKTIVVFRNPVSARRSLIKFKPKMRNHPIYYMWNAYYGDILKNTNRAECFFIEFDNFLNNKAEYIAKLYKYLGIRIKNRRKLLSFVSLDLRHYEESAGLEKKTKTLYKTLVNIAEKNGNICNNNKL